ncbi:MAG: nickel-dependent lactate racemase [Candidatus Korobacteraceae bacterium]
MQVVKFPFGDKFLELELDREAEVLMPELVPAAPDKLAVIRQAMVQPIGCERLAKLAKGKNSVAIVVNDITRPAPSEAMLTVIMEELTEAGIDAANVTVIVAVGNHELPTPEELQAITGQWCSRLKIVSHNCYDDSSLTYAGETPRHVPVYVNTQYAKASLKILTGLITPHQSAGFSGGRKSVVPGIAGIKTIATHHSFPIRPEGPVMGIIQGNVFHQEAVAAARLAGADFIVNVIKNYRGEVVEAVAGGLEQAHARGVEICEKTWVRKFDAGYDVIFVSPGGYPKDIDLHQSQKAVSVAEQVVNPGGTIVLVAECRKGIGKFGATLKAADSVETVIRNFYEQGFTAEGHTSKAYMFARVCKKCRVLVVTSGIEPKELAEMFMTGFTSLAEAASVALSNYKQPKILCIPYTGECIPVLTESFVTA